MVIGDGNDDGGGVGILFQNAILKSSRCISDFPCIYCMVGSEDTAPNSAYIFTMHFG